MYSTTISSDLIDRPGLEALVETVRKSTGKQINLQEQFIVETDDINITCMMDSLRDTLRAPAAKVKASNGHKKVKTVKKVKTTEMGAGSRRNVATGEIISVFALKEKLAAGGIAPETVFEDRKGQRFVVLAGDLVKEPKS